MHQVSPYSAAETGFISIYVPLVALRMLIVRPAISDIFEPETSFY